MTKHYTGHRITVNFRVRDVPFPRSRTKYMPGEGGDRQGLRVASRIEGDVHECLHLSAQTIVDRDLYLRRCRDFEAEAGVPAGGVGEGRVERELIREAEPDDDRLAEGDGLGAAVESCVRSGHFSR